MAIADRIIRSVLAIGFIGLYMTGQVTGTAGKVLLGLSAIFLVTSLLGSCPIYQAIGVSTLSAGRKVG